MEIFYPANFVNQFLNIVKNFLQILQTEINTRDRSKFSDFTMFVVI